MAMVNGVYLTLLAGPVLPAPVPQFVTESLTSVRVTIATTEAAGKGEAPVPARSGFELQFSLGKRSPLETLFLLAGGSAPPLLRVILIATLNGNPEVIIDGFVQKHDVKHGTATTPSVLTLFGMDITAAMDFVKFTGLPMPGMPVPVRVLFVLAKYAVLGVLPIVIPTVFPDVDDPTSKIVAQQGSDFAYLCKLARDAGYVFYVEPGPVPGTNKAYWGPEVKVGVPQPALNYDMDANTNVETLSFQFDNSKKTAPLAFVRLDAVPIPIPVPLPDVSLTNPPLGLISPISLNIETLSDTAKMSLPQAMLFGLSKAAAAAECVTGEGTLNVVRYGRLLKARQLVGVRGAGTAFDGLYYVKSVMHEIRRGEYKQSFKLSRNGLVSTVPTVPV